MNPADLLRHRAAALASGDFETIYDSYHPEAPFLQQFPARQEYLDFAAGQLAGRCRIERLEVLRQRQVGAGEGITTELLLHQLLRIDDAWQETLELALLRRHQGRWCYLGSYRIERAALDCPLAEVDFNHFDSYPTKVLI